MQWKRSRQDGPDPIATSHDRSAAWGASFERIGIRRAVPYRDTASRASQLRSLRTRSTSRASQSSGLVRQSAWSRPTDHSKRGLERVDQMALASQEAGSFPWPVRQRLRASSRDFSDTDRIQKTKGLAGNHRLTPVILGSPTWARTRDLRINSCELADLARLLETSWDC